MKYFYGKANRKFFNGIVSKLRRKVSLQMLISLYCTLLHSYISYGSIVWYFTSNKNKYFLKIIKLKKKKKVLPPYDLLILPCSLYSAIQHTKDFQR